jgi:hypothetical protein
MHFMGTVICIHLVETGVWRKSPKGNVDGGRCHDGISYEPF